MHPDTAVRPEHLVLVVGTATEVGKTFVAARLLRRLRDLGVQVAASKPAQSFDPSDGSTDADLLASSAGQSAHDVCPSSRWYEVPLAPPMAADVLGVGPVWLDSLVAEIAWPEGTHVACLEAVGGVRSPLAHDGDSVDLAAAVNPDLVLLVAEANLGAINEVRLAAAVFGSRPVTVFLNRFDHGDSIHLRNRSWLSITDEMHVVTSIDELLADHPDWSKAT